LTASQSILATSPTLISISCQVLFRTVSGLRSRKDNTMQAPIYINKNKYLYVECQSWHRGVRSPEKGLSSPHLQTQCFTSDPLVMKTGFSRLVSFFPEQLELPFSPPLLPHIFIVINLFDVCRLWRIHFAVTCSLFRFLF